MKFNLVLLIILVLGVILGLKMVNNVNNMPQKFNTNIPNPTKGLDSQNIFNAHTPAPELTGITAWVIPTKQFTLKSLLGKVVLVDFWTNQCINCIHTLPYITKWYDTYSAQGFVVIGVHTPELASERTISSIQTAIKTYGIKYPVVQDNNFTTWNSYNNEYWPGEYLIDKKGIIRRTYFGEGEYDKTELAIQTLLKE